MKSSVANLRALAHPLRLRILEVLAAGPLNPKQIADRLKVPRTRLYHHVSAMERAGLLRLRETRKNRGTMEKWYEIVGQELAPLSDSTERRKVAPALAAVVMSQTSQELLAALRNPAAPEPVLFRLTANLSAPTLQRINQRLEAVLQEIQEASASRKAGGSTTPASRWALTMCLAPVEDPR